MWTIFLIKNITSTTKWTAGHFLRSLHYDTNMFVCKLFKQLFCNGWFITALCLNFLSEPAHGAAMTVVDALGRNVQVTVPIQRIVALNSDVIEVLRTLKAEECVVGVFSEIVREREFWGNVAERPKVGHWRDPDMEAIAALKPDLVIAYSQTPGPRLEQKMALFGIHVLRLDFYKIDTLEQEIQVLGKLLNRSKEAARFCEWHQRYLGMIHGRIAPTVRRPTVYLESYTDYHAVGPGSGGHEMCMRAGGRNIAADLSIPYPQVTPEWVVSQNPEVIIKAASYGNGYALTSPEPFNQHRDAIVRRPAWSRIPAVVTKNVHVMDSAIWTGPRAIIGVAYMARWFYPALFCDFDPASLHKEYLENFQGMAYRGVFISDDASEAGR